MSEIQSQDSSLPKEDTNNPNQIQTQPIIQDEQLLGVYGEMLDLVREDRQKADELMKEFLNLMINDGDGSSSTKEAVVQLLKVKIDAVNNMGKVADLMTRIKLREKDTMPDYLKVNHNQDSSKLDPADKKRLIRELNKAVDKKKKDA